MLLGSTLPRARGGTASMLFLLANGRSHLQWPKVSIYGDSRAVWGPPLLCLTIRPPGVAAKGEREQGPWLSPVLLRRIVIALPVMEFLHSEGEPVRGLLA